MIPSDYKRERQKRGSQSKVAALLSVRVATISDRETGKQPINREAWLALLSLPVTDNDQGDSQSPAKNI